MKTYSRYVKPQVGILDSAIERLTGITGADLYNADRFDIVLKDFSSRLPDECIMISWSLTDLSQLQKEMKADYELLLPSIINGTQKVEDGSFFDFSTNTYVPLEDAASKIAMLDKKKLDTSIDRIEQYFEMMGIVFPIHYPIADQYAKESIEQLPARIDGKRICEFLRKQRLALAKANGIEFSSPRCKAIGPCAGTCKKCDEEAIYLRDKLKEIDQDKQKIPDFDFDSWEVMP